MGKTNRLFIQYTPLDTSFSLVAQGGSLRQVHSAEKDEYLPNREITPLRIAPIFHVVDADGVILSGDKANELVDVRWYEGTEAIGNLIASGSDGYVINADASITVGKNAPYLSPLVLIFTAKYLDVRTNNVLRIHESVTLTTNSLTETPIASLEIDKPNGWVFDPLTDTGLRTVTATLRLAGETVVAERQKYWWYKIVGGEQVLLTADELCYESGAGTATITIDPRYIDGNMLFRVKAEYIAPGEATPTNPTASAKSCDMVVNRRYSAWEDDWFINGGNNPTTSVSAIKAESVITRKGSVYANAMTKFTVLWELKKQVANAQWGAIGYGENVLIPKADYISGAHISCDVKEREALKAICIDGAELAINGVILTA